MSEFGALSVSSLVCIPVWLGCTQGAIAISGESTFPEDNSRFLVAQTSEAIELSAQPNIQSGSEHTIVTTDGNLTQIEGGVQAGSNLFHRFDGFGIGVGETADFVTTESTQAVFGQVSGGGASYIDGRLQVSGSDADLYLVNPAGVLFGQNARLNLEGSLTVTTADQVGFAGGWLDVADVAPDYTSLTGVPEAYRFTTDAPGAVVNQADLAVGEGQSIRLVGGDVVNTGDLQAAGGEVTLAAVKGKTTADADSDLVRLGSQGALLSVEVAEGAVAAPERWNPLSVPELLTGASATTGADSLQVNEDGSVDLLVADTAVGSIESGDTEGRLLSVGSVDVSGAVGGEIDLLGSAIDVVGGQLNASGEKGGGTIHVGGGYQGQGALPTAERLTFGERASAIADSFSQGDGGQVVLWSNGRTQFDGQLSARASGLGDGGSIETSGLKSLDIGRQASVSTQAERGQVGTWLLDPDDLRVVPTTTGADIGNGTNEPSSASELDPTILADALEGNNVLLQANNTITIDAEVDATGNAAAGTLRLDAPTLNLNERILLRSDSFLEPGSATTVNVSGNGSVQNAVDAVATGGTVNIAAGTYREDSDILVQRSVTLQGQGRDSTVLEGGAAHRVLTLSGAGGWDLSDDIDVTIDGLAVKDGSSNRGSGIAALGGVNLLLANSLVENNRSDLDATAMAGGLFFNQTGSSIIRNTTINNNFSNDIGGGLVVYGIHQLSIENSTLSNNRASGNGGAIDSNSLNAAIEIVGGRLIANSSASNGGGISVNDTYLSIDGTEFSANVADGRGGAINAFDGTVDIKNATFAENIATSGVGGAIAANGNLTIEEALFENNIALEGGAIALQVEGNSSIDRTTFFSNDANYYGGAIRLDGGQKLTVSNSTFYENTTDGKGGAVRVISTSPGVFNLINSTVTQNEANSDGGGLSIATRGDVTVENSTVVNNRSGGVGGGIDIQNFVKSPAIRRTIVAGNTSSFANPIPDVRGDFVSGGRNLIQDRRGSRGYVGTDLPDGTDPGLATLADNGGGLLTAALLPGSAAINAGGTVASDALDQRGFSIVGDRDIGAYEYLAEGASTVGNLLFVAGENQVATVDTNYTSLFQVKVTDTFGNALSGIKVDFTLPISGASGTINTGNSLLTTDINGIASLAVRANTIAGSYDLKAETVDGLANSLVTVTNRADVASKFAITGPTSTLTAGEKVNFSVTALDRFNNVADSYNNAVQLSSSDPEALLPASGMLTNGRIDFEATPITSGTQVLTVADAIDPTISASVDNISVTSAAAAMLSVLPRQSTTATVGTAFEDGLSVRVSDRFGNSVAGEAVTFSVPDTGASAVLDSAVVITDSLGLATGTLRANDVAGSYQAIANAFGLSALFELENEATVPSPSEEAPTPVVPAPVVPAPVVPAPVVPITNNLAPTDLAPTTNAEGISPGLSNSIIPLEGTTEVTLSKELVDEVKPRSQQSLSNRAGLFDEVAFAETERLLSDEYAKYWRSTVGKASTLDSVQETLRRAQMHHKSKSAVVYALFVPSGKQGDLEQYPSVLSQRLLRNEIKQDDDRLMLVMVPPEGQPVQQLMDVSRREIVRQAQLLGIEISMVEEDGYQPLARQLYGWLLAPIESELQNKGIDNLMYVMDEGLRTMPLAAMMAGDRFAIEDYGISVLPSMGLLNANFDTAPSSQAVLTAGADRFEDLEALPAVPVELGLVAEASSSSQLLLNEDFSLDGLLSAQATKPKEIIHLATHAAFNPGALERSYVQLWEEKLTLDEIANLDLEGLEMLILSACATAMGSQDAELGFAGLAAATGVEASIGSLWNVSDLGTMALMAEFYEQLRQDPLRFVALQQAQLALLRGETRLENNKLITQKGENTLPDGFLESEKVTFSHPFFWSGFTLIGSPWW